ncbi:RICIN domain-containing protein [Bacillus thuringiensis]
MMLPEGDGDYKIGSYISASKVLDANFGSGNNVRLYDLNDNANQHWTFKYDSTKRAYQISIHEQDPNYVLTGQTGNSVVVTENKNNDDQYWIWENGQSGSYYIKNYKDPKMVLDVTGGNTDNSTPIRMHEKNGVAAQLFKVDKVQKLTGSGWVHSNGKWFYLSPADGTKNSKGESFAKGQMVTGWIKLDDNNKKWFYLSPEDGTKNSKGESFAKGQMMTGIVDLTDRPNHTQTFYFSPNNETKNSAGELFAEGQMVIGWIDFGNEKWHYFCNGTYETNKGRFILGEMVKGVDIALHTNEKTNGGDGEVKNYRFDSDGVLKK